MLLYALIGLALFSMTRAIIAYFKFYFYIKDEELIVNKGILQKKKLSIPFDRIQSVNFSQSIFHQMFNIVQLEIDTAGSKNAEFTFDAIDKDTAEILREKLLSGKKSSPSEGSDNHHEDATLESTITDILQLDIPSLIKVGVSQNHIRSGGLIFVVGFWAIQSLEDIGYDTDDMIKDSFTKGFQQSLQFFLLAMLLFVLVSFMISLIRTVITHYDLKLWKEGDKYKLVSGLFTRKERAAINNKIQILQWSDNLLKKGFGIYDVQLKQASSAEVGTKSSIQIPGCSDHHIQYLKENWLGQEALGQLDKVPVTKHFLYRKILFRMLFSALLITVAFLFANLLWKIIAVATIPYFIYTSWLSYQKTGFAINDHTLFMSKGVFGDAYAIMPIYKVQNIKLLQTPYQVRNGIANVQVHTASGSMTIPYIELDMAKRLIDYLLYKAEISRKAFM